MVLQDKQPSELTQVYKCVYRDRATSTHFTKICNRPAKSHQISGNERTIMCNGGLRFPQSRGSINKGKNLFFDFCVLVFVPPPFFINSLGLDLSIISSATITMCLLNQNACRAFCLQESEDWTLVTAKRE